MTDDIQTLRNAFRDQRIKPGKAAKKAALEQAMAAFDEKNLRAVQGSGIGTRLKDKAHALFETLIGRRPMRMNPVLAGGASLGVLLVASLSATYIGTSNLRPIDLKVPLLPKQAEPAKRELDTLAPRIAQESRDAGGLASVPVSPVVSMPAPAIAPAPPPGYAMRPVGNRAIGGVARNRSALDGSYARRVKRLEVRPDGTLVARGQALSDRYVPGDVTQQGRDQFESKTQNPVKVTSEDPVSTFSIDVDTASYSFVRSSLNNNVLPHKDAVRVEELVNYFAYDYEKPRDRAVPFKANVSVFPSPWNKDRKLMHVGIAGYDIDKAEKPGSNLVFLLDTSGSMNAANKLPLVINSMKLLLETLKPDDTVSIVTYAGNAGTALEPTKVKDKAKILAALNGLRSRGSTAGAEGIRQAYELAKQNYDKDGVNRVILATDGDFNVGITDRNELKSYIERQRDSGIFLSVLGFGRGNYNDALMQTLAQNGNGNAAYIDTLNEARKVLVEEASSTLFPIAKDVKIQVEFNPQKVAEYRLIGYETRMLKREDFNNDKVDAGDIGAGHRVTAIYEFTPKGSPTTLDSLRYGASQSAARSGGASDEYAFLKIRYKLPKESVSKLITTPVTATLEKSSVSAAPREARFASAVAAFGQILKGGKYTGAYSHDDVIALAQGAKGKDDFGYRAEFINLVRLAKSAQAMEPLQRR